MNELDDSFTAHRTTQEINFLFILCKKQYIYSRALYLISVTGDVSVLGSQEAEGNMIKLTFGRI